MSQIRVELRLQEEVRYDGAVSFGLLNGRTDESDFIKEAISAAVEDGQISLDEAKLVKGRVYRKPSPAAPVFNG